MIRLLCDNYQIMIPDNTCDTLCDDDKYIVSSQVYRSAFKVAFRNGNQSSSVANVKRSVARIPFDDGDIREVILLMLI